MFPNLLVNGSTGISAGYATEIPPHQIGEVIDAAIMRIDKPEATVADLMTVIKGPDFLQAVSFKELKAFVKPMKQVKGK